jgi:hypothetical protein
VLPRLASTSWSFSLSLVSAENTGMHHRTQPSCLEYIQRNEIVGSMVTSCFHVWRVCQTVFQSNPTIYMAEGLPLLYILVSTCYCVRFSFTAILGHLVALMCIALNTNGVKHLFLHFIIHSCIFFGEMSIENIFRF